MPGSRPLNVGPYRFSLHDARRTIAEAIDVLAEFPESTHDAQTQRRVQVEALVGSVDVMVLGVDEAQRMLNMVWPLMMSAREDRVRVGNLPATATGRVVQLNRSSGGVPKLPVDSIEVGYGGVIGDVQKTRRHHGKPNQALCLWNIESIESLRADGHPIDAGSAGENVTVGGLAWSDVTPGVRLQIGGVLCEVSCYAWPCAQNARWFNDREFSRIHPANGPHSRVYATVLEPGHVVAGDTIVLEPNT
jgi:MOSC domain-containing protein YiiM